MIRVVTKRPGFRAIVEEIVPVLRSYQSIVGGLIQPMIEAPDGSVLWCNEEGKLQRLPVNFRRPIDLEPCVGAVVAVAYDLGNRAISMTADVAAAWCVFLDSLAEITVGPLMAEGD